MQSSERERTWDQQMSIGPFVLLGVRIFDPIAGRFLTPGFYANVNNQFVYTSGIPVGFADSLAKDNGFDRAVDALGSTFPAISLPICCGLLGVEPFPILLLMALKRRRSRLLPRK